MRKFFKNLMIGMMTLVGGFMTSSCDNSLTYEPNPNDSIQVQLVHTPDVVAYSGQQVLGSTFGTRTMNLPAMYSANPNQNEWENVPADITDYERDYVAKWFEENPGFSDEAWDFTDFYVQHVYTRPGNKEGIWHRYDQNRPTNEGKPANWDEDFSDYGAMDKLQCGQSTDNLEDVNNFNATSGSIMLMENSSAKQWGYHSTWGTENGGYFQYYRAALIDVPGIGLGYYVGLSYYAKKSDNGNKELGIQRLNYCDDWIIKITPANGIVTPPNTNEKCDKCDHPKHGEYCDECVEGNDCYKDSPVINPDNTEVPEHVEVNLSLNDSHEGYVSKDLWSKLSIHVRCATDVKITIPIESKYICESDDLAILQNHVIENWKVDTENHSVQYNINGNIVTLTTSFEFTEDGNSGTITVTTDGITQELIDYLMEQNGDGINFEVYLYWQSEINGEVLDYVSREELQGFLNESTIEFLDKTPDLYVNAFNDKENGEVFEGDCTVNIVDKQSGEYPNNKTGYWYNGSPFNELYYKED